jgi:hypothetical protein
VRIILLHRSVVLAATLLYDGSNVRFTTAIDKILKINAVHSVRKVRKEEQEEKRWGWNRTVFPLFSRRLDLVCMAESGIESDEIF